MHYAINIINFGDCGDARVLADLAQDAEAAGWDGFFIWDHIAWDWGVMPMVDPWIALTAIALSTERVRLGAMVTPIPRRRPWKFARETVSLDHLSDGRLVVGVGIGITKAEFDNLGEPGDFKIRGAMLDEGLEVVEKLWCGESFSFDGQYYKIKDTQFLPAPQQSPRIPVWVAGMWPNRRPFRRAARWDGVFPIPAGGAPEEMLTPDDIRDIMAYVQRYRGSDRPFDVSIGGDTPGDDPARAAETVSPYAAAGVTWWHEAIHGFRPDLAQRAEESSWVDAMRWRILQGPPRIE
ncbi:MAG: LLM class flavin-dependent oxidoreductase [Chloroflexota bacterium]|nr:LLM class flavin-dependent oxidoreductase [Chloroflexota bacterium]